MYYVIWIYVLPHFGGYQIRQEVIPLPFGANTHRLVKVKNGDVAAWDNVHDLKGNLISEDTSENLGSLPMNDSKL